MTEAERKVSTVSAAYPLWEVLARCYIELGGDAGRKRIIAGTPPHPQARLWVTGSRLAFPFLGSE